MMNFIISQGRTLSFLESNGKKSKVNLVAV